MLHWKTMDKTDRYTLVSSVIVPLVLWWIYNGHKYSTSGRR